MNGTQPEDDLFERIEREDKVGNQSKSTPIKKGDEAKAKKKSQVANLVKAFESAEKKDSTELEKDKVGTAKRNQKLVFESSKIEIQITESGQSLTKKPVPKCAQTKQGAQ